MTADDPVFRPLRIEDAALLGEFFAAVADDPDAVRFFDPHPLTRQHASVICSQPAHSRNRYFALWVRGRIAGYSMLRGWDEGYEFPTFGVCVHPALRNVGVGRWLLARAIEESRSAGARKLRLTVHEANHRAIHLYRQFGFVLEAYGNGKQVGMLDIAESSATVCPLNTERLADWQGRLPEDRGASPVKYAPTS
jgi:ribosomal protein S18 acetylase RimI-like enzyme